MTENMDGIDVNKQNVAYKNKHILSGKILYCSSENFLIYELKPQDSIKKIILNIFFAILNHREELKRGQNNKRTDNLPNLRL